MAICVACGHDMKSADSCIPLPVTIEKVDHLPIRFGEEQRYSELDFLKKEFEKADRCNDCNVLKGKIHHPGCDIEECPVCRHQLIGCGCLQK